MTAPPRLALITGGAGFIGTHLTSALRYRGWNVRIIDCHPPAQPVDGEFVLGDVRDRDSMMRAAAGADVVFHLAAAHHDVGIAPKTFYEVNVQGTECVLQACRTASIRTFIFYSSVAVYGDSDAIQNEEARTQPTSHYGASKLGGENRVLDWAREASGRRAIIVRPAVVFGPNNYANMYALIRQIHRGAFFPVGRGDNVKSLVYVDNLIASTLSALALANANVTMFNAVDEPNMRSREIVTTICAALGKTYPSLHLPMWFAKLMAMPFDLVSRATGARLPVSKQRVIKLFAANTAFTSIRASPLSAADRVEATEGIRLMVRWYLEEGQLVHHLPRLPSASRTVDQHPTTPNDERIRQNSPD